MMWSDLATVFIRMGAPSIGRALGGPAGEKVGEVVGGMLGDALGVPGTPEAVDAAIASNPVAAEVAIGATEADARIQEAIAATERAVIGATLEMAKNDREEGWFAYAWRPGMMYLIGFFWLWSFVLQPILVAGGLPVPAVDLSALSTLTITYLGLYMGGHTIKAATSAKGPAS